MTMDKSLRVRLGLTRARSVLSRAERIQRLKTADRWQEGDSPFGLAKVRVYKLAMKKKKKKKEEEEGAEGAEGAAAAAPADAAKKEAPKKEGAARSSLSDQCLVAVAQLVRVPDCGSGCCGFKSHQPPLRIDLSRRWPAKGFVPASAAGRIDCLTACCDSLSFVLPSGIIGGFWAEDLAPFGGNNRDQLPVCSLKKRP